MQTILYFFNKIADILYKISFFDVFSLFGHFSISMPIAVLVLLYGFVYLTIKLNFIQFRYTIFAFKQMLGKKPKSEDTGNKVSPIKTMFTAIASSAGLNNTAGIASMVLIAGPGTVFWTPIIILLSMAFRFAEVYLSHHYRSDSHARTLGGPFDYITKGFAEIGHKKLGISLSKLYAALVALSGLIGISAIEINQGVVILTNNIDFLHGKEAALGLVAVIFAGYVVFGGVARIASLFATILPPLIMTFLFISLYIIVAKYKNIPSAFNIILQDAFSSRSLAGGVLASFIITFRRVSMGSETGLGTAGIVHSSSSEKDSVKEALSGMISPIVNGVFIILMTALVMVLTDAYKINDKSIDGIVLLSKAFGSVNSLFPIVLVVLIPIMALNVMIGWSNYGVSCVTYVLGKKFVNIFLVLYLLNGFLSVFIKDFQLIMKITDGIVMTLPLINIPVVIILTKKMRNEVKKKIKI